MVCILEVPSSVSNCFESRRKASAGIFFGVAVGAVKLHTFIGRMDDDLCPVELGHRGLHHVRKVPVFQPCSLVNQSGQRFMLHLHFRNLLLDQLVSANLFSELVLSFAYLMDCSRMAPERPKGAGRTAQAGCVQLCHAYLESLVHLSENNLLGTLTSSKAISAVVGSPQSHLVV